MAGYIMALDQGTTSSRAVIFDTKGNLIAKYNVPFVQHYPKDGYVEHRPALLLDSCIEAMQQVLLKSQIDVCDILSIGIANQRETVLAWDKITGTSFYNAIVWQCRRSSDFCLHLKQQGLESFIAEKTGLVIDPYFSASKMHWLFENVADVKKAAQQNRLLLGTVDSFLCYHLLKEQPHITDHSNASRTMLYNIHTLQWDEDLLSLFQIPKESLPQVVPSSSFIGHLKKEILGREIPVTALCGDQQAALFGQCCFESGDVKNTYGTGCFILMHTGSNALRSKHSLITSLAASTDSTPSYLLEGSVFVAGAAVQWLRDDLNILSSAQESEMLARSVKDSAGTVFVPAFTGLGAPYWDPSSRGSLYGLTRGTTKAHIARATLEAIAFQSSDVLLAMQEDFAQPIQQLKVDGGASANHFLMQFQADILEMEVLRGATVESTALGAAYLAGLASGVWQNKEQLRSLYKEDKVFIPTMEPTQRKKHLALWHKAVSRSLHWLES